MKLPQCNTQTPVYSYTRTELLSLRTKTSLLSLSTVNRLKDLSMEWWRSGQYFDLPITRSVVQFPLRKLIYVLPSSYVDIYLYISLYLSIYFSIIDVKLMFVKELCRVPAEFLLVGRSTKTKHWISSSTPSSFKSRCRKEETKFEFIHCCFI